LIGKLDNLLGFIAEYQGDYAAALERLRPECRATKNSPGSSGHGELAVCGKPRHFSGPATSDLARQWDAAAASSNARGLVRAADRRQREGSRLAV